MLKNFAQNPNCLGSGYKPKFFGYFGMGFGCLPKLKLIPETKTKTRLLKSSPLCSLSLILDTKSELLWYIIVKKVVKKYKASINLQLFS
jgi:hypothetical protein